MPVSPSLVASRYLVAGVVVPFPREEAPPRPKGKAFRFKGHAYALSTDGGPLGDSAEGTGGWAEEMGEGGAKIIRGPAPLDPWKYLWVYDTDRNYVAMWRVHDGNEKDAGSAEHFDSDIARLERKGQINRVSHQEFQALEAEMRKREHALLKALERSIEENKDEYQRAVDEAAQEVFDKKILPGIKRRVAEVLRGILPFDFKPNDRILDYAPVEEQAVSHVITQEMEAFTPKLVEEEVRRRGYDPSDSAHDVQAISWAVDDVRQKAWETLKRKAQRVIRKMAAESHTFTFTIGEHILYGKWKNKHGIIKNIGTDPKGNPIILVEPVPKGRKQDKVMGLFRVWKAPSVPAVVARYLGR